MTLRARLLLVISAVCFLPLLDILYNIGKNQETMFVYVLVLVVFVFLGSYASVIKIDDVVNAAEARAIRSEARLQTFAESTKEGIVRLDAAGKIIEINTALAQMLGHAPDFLAGKNLWDYLLGGESLARKMRALPADLRRATLDAEGLKRDSSKVNLHIDLYLLGSAGKTTGYQGFVRTVMKEVDLRKVKQDLLQGLYNELREALDSLPLAGDEPRAAEELVLGLLRIRTELSARLDLASLEDASFAARRGVVEFNLVLNQLKDFFTPVAARRGIELSFEGIETPQIFMGDADALFVAFRNLIVNALKFTRQGGSVHVRLEILPDDFILSVRDTGVGVAEADRAFLFKPFFRAESATAAKAGGVGLGLWLVQRVVAAHGGQVWADSELGKGSTFFARFPRQGAVAHRDQTGVE